jgi:hypothetical protein
MYTTVFPEEGNRLVVVSQQGAGPVRLAMIDTDRLEPIQDLAAVDAMVGYRKKPFYAERGVVATENLPIELEPGEHRLHLGDWYSDLPELLFLAHPSASPGAGVAINMFSVRPREGTISVLLQDWFNRGDYDIGYEWPTRVARDQETGRIYGEGFRLRPFLLSKDGRNVEKWLSEEPFYGWNTLRSSGE